MLNSIWNARSRISDCKSSPSGEREEEMRMRPFEPGDSLTLSAIA